MRLNSLSQYRVNSLRFKVSRKLPETSFLKFSIRGNSLSDSKQAINSTSVVGPKSKYFQDSRRSKLSWRIQISTSFASTYSKKHRLVFSYKKLPTWKKFMEACQFVQRLCYSYFKTEASNRYSATSQFGNFL
jgi:hypothetical protein